MFQRLNKTQKKKKQKRIKHEEKDKKVNIVDPKNPYMDWYIDLMEIYSNNNISLVDNQIKKNHCDGKNKNIEDNDNNICTDIDMEIMDEFKIQTKDMIDTWFKKNKKEEIMIDKKKDIIQFISLLKNKKNELVYNMGYGNNYNNNTKKNKADLQPLDIGIIYQLEAWLLYLHAKNNNEHSTTIYFEECLKKAKCKMDDDVIPKYSEWKKINEKNIAIQNKIILKENEYTKIKKNIEQYQLKQKLDFMKKQKQKKKLFDIKQKNEKQNDKELANLKIGLNSLIINRKEIFMHLLLLL